MLMIIVLYMHGSFCLQWSCHSQWNIINTCWIRDTGHNRTSKKEGDRGPYGSWKWNPIIIHCFTWKESQCWCSNDGFSTCLRRKRGNLLALPLPLSVPHFFKSSPFVYNIRSSRQILNLWSITFRTFWLIYAENTVKSAVILSNSLS